MRAGGQPGDWSLEGPGVRAGGEPGDWSLEGPGVRASGEPDIYIDDVVDQGDDLKILP